MSANADTFERHAETIAALAREPMAAAAGRCAGAWFDPHGLDRVLAETIGAMPHCALLYVLDAHGTQVSSNVTPTDALPELRGQNLDGRPFLARPPRDDAFSLSAAYLSQQGMRLCVTALHRIESDGRPLGHLAADFPLHDVMLGARARAGAEDGQFRGDPAVRETLFLQRRATSRMDARIDAVLGQIERAMRHYGVFHVEIHFSSSRATLWNADDPFVYRIHDADELASGVALESHRPQIYPSRSVVSAARIAPVFTLFKALRFADDTVYLRVGSLNLANGTVGLTFSCDGSHYLGVDDFLAKGLDYWLGR